MSVPNLPPEWPELSELGAYKCDQAKGWVGAQINMQEGADRPLYLRGMMRAIAARYGNDDFEAGFEATMQLVRDAFGERFMELNPS